MLPCHGRCQVKLKNGNASAGPIHWRRPNFPFPRHDVLLLQSLVCKENKQPSTSHTDTTLYTCNVEKEKKGFNNGFSTKTFGNAVKLKFKKKTHFNVIRPSMRTGMILTVLFPVDVVPDNATCLHNMPICTEW